MTVEKRKEGRKEGRKKRKNEGRKNRWTKKGIRKKYVRAKGKFRS